jgi:hypothetical protein
LYTKEALAHQPIADFPPPSNIGGVDPVPMQSAVPTMDPSLAVTPKPTPAVRSKGSGIKPAKKKP